MIGTITNSYQPIKDNKMDNSDVNSMNIFTEANLKVEFKKLPFYDILGVLVEPRIVNMIQMNDESQKYRFSFALTTSQASAIAMNREVGPDTRNEYIVQVLLRFFVCDPTSEQEDLLPKNVEVKVNKKFAPLPRPPPVKQGAEPKRVKKPINISHLLKLCPKVKNSLVISWTPEDRQYYVVGVYLVRKLSVQDLLERLKAKTPRLSAYSRNLIIQMYRNDDNELLALENIRLSIICPIGKMRMKTPCIGVDCCHLQCFDAETFLSMNEKTPTWKCPVCNKPALYDSLQIDEYFQVILDSPQMAGGRTHVILYEDGSWLVDDTAASDAASSCTLTPTEGEATVCVDSPEAGQAEENINVDDDSTNDDIQNSIHSESDVDIVEVTSSKYSETDEDVFEGTSDNYNEVIISPQECSLSIGEIFCLDYTSSGNASTYTYSDSSSNLSAAERPLPEINPNRPPQSCGSQTLVWARPDSHHRQS